MLDATFDLTADWSDAQNPSGPWSLNQGNDLLAHFASWHATNQPAWAPAGSGQSSTPAWFKDSTIVLAEAQPGDVVVVTAAADSGNGPANVAWISPGDGMITVSGSVWNASDSIADHQWTLYDDSEAISTGTILAGEFTRVQPFNLALGAGGPAPIRNIPVAAGEVVKLVLTSSQSDYLGVNLSVSFNSSGIPQYDLGSIPSELTPNGQPVSFFVNPPQGQSGPLSMQVDPPPLGATSFNASTGQFTYTPDARDKFDFTVLFTAGDGGTWDAPAAQVITVSPNTIAPEFDLVSQQKPLPDPASKDYITVSETVNQLSPNSRFNAAPHASTRNVAISGKTVNLTPGDPNGLFERFAYTDPAGQSVVNSDIQNLSVYAESLVIGGNLRLPQTNVTIYARNLIFQDAAGRIARIDTTPLNYLTGAAPAQSGQPGQDGLAGENAGSVTLHTGSISIPSTSSVQRFIMRGGRGQDAGPGLPGRDGQSMPAFSLDTRFGRYDNVVYLFRYHQNDVSQGIAGTAAWPGDGQPATPGGRPGYGGSGGQLVAYSATSLVPFVDVAGGAPGTRPADQPGGAAGQPNPAAWAVYYSDFGWYFPWDTHSSIAGAGWLASGGDSGADGVVQSIPIGEVPQYDWLHPSALRAMLSYAKDAYVNGNIDYAAQAFGEYSRMVDSIASPPSDFAQQFDRMRSEIATLENQAANHLDYFGNPPGWAPTLSFAANYRAYQNQIDGDIRILFLTRLIQTSAANQQNTANAITKALIQLDAEASRAVDSFNTSQLLLPELQHQLDVIANQTTVVQQQLAAKELELEGRAAKNVADRHKVPGWKKSLTVLATVASAVPIPAVSAIGTSVISISNFLSDPSISNVGALKGVTNPFTKQRLDQSSAELKNEFALLKPPTGSTLQELKDYTKRLSELGKKWGPVLDAYKNATKATQVPATEIDAELASLKAEDTTFNGLVDEVAKLNGQKEVFSEDLARAMQTLSDSMKQITSDYTAAESLNSQLSNLAGGLRHDMLEQVKQMERNARDRLLKYQYYMAKAFEYEMLQPYNGNYQLGHLLDAITTLLANNPDANWLDDPAHFEALKSIYESDLHSTADLIWTNLDTNAPQRTSTLQFRLSPSQVDALNTQGQVTINLVDMGFISPSRQNSKILQIGAKQITSTLGGPFAQLANVQFEFDHSGVSLVQSKGQKYVFQHSTSSSDDPIFWATDYEAIMGDLVQAEISPSQISAIAAILGLNPTAVTPDQAGRLYAHPSSWADITIRTTVTVVPATVDVNLQEVWLFVRYDSDRPQEGSVVLDVRADEGTSPRILVDKADFSDRTDGRGSFTRFFNQGQAVTLSAQPAFGQLWFTSWEDATGQLLTTSPSLTRVLDKDTQVHAVYLPDPGSWVTTHLLNGGSPQRSSIESLEIQFGVDVSASLDSGDLTLRNDTTATWIDVAGVTPQYDPATSTALWNLGGIPLTDGNYTATLSRASVTDAAGRQLPADYLARFFRVLGDTDGTASVDIFDVAKLQVNYGQTSGMTPADGDFDGNGTVDIFDVAILQVQFGKTLAPPAPAPSAAPTVEAVDESKPQFSAKPTAAYNLAEATQMAPVSRLTTGSASSLRSAAADTISAASPTADHRRARRNGAHLAHRIMQPLAVHHAVENASWESAVDRLFEADESRL